MEFTATECIEERKILDTIKNNISIECKLYFDVPRSYDNESSYCYDTKTGEFFIADERGSFKTEKIIDNTYKFDEFIQKEIIDKIPQRYISYREDKIRKLKQYKDAEEKLVKKEEEFEFYKNICDENKKEKYKKESELLSNLKSFKYLFYVSSFTLLSVIILKFIL